MTDETPDRAEHSACPSSPCQTGAVLVGLVGSDGRIDYVGERLAVGEDFVRAAHEGRPPEQRFRFSMPCMGKACVQWDGRECGLIDRLMLEFERQLGTLRAPDPLPACPIRGECRWFAQRGGTACGVCEVLVTDVGRPAMALPREVLRRRESYSSTREGA